MILKMVRMSPARHLRCCTPSVFNDLQGEEMDQAAFFPSPNYDTLMKNNSCPSVRAIPVLELRRRRREPENAI